MKTMSSKELAKLVCKRHAQVLRDCYALNNEYLKMDLPEIKSAFYKASKGKRQYVEYLLTLRQTDDLMKLKYDKKYHPKVSCRWCDIRNPALN